MFRSFLLQFDIFFFMYCEKRFGRHTQSDQSDHSKGIQTVPLTATDSFTGVVGFPKDLFNCYATH